MLSETQSLKLTGSPSLLLPPCPFPTRRAELNGEQTAKKVKERVFLSIQSHRSIFDALALFPSLLTTSSLPHISPCSSHCPPLHYLPAFVTILPNRPLDQTSSQNLSLKLKSEPVPLLLKTFPFPLAHRVNSAWRLDPT